jgi:hypothetical protein
MFSKSCPIGIEYVKICTGAPLLTYCLAAVGSWYHSGVMMYREKQSLSPHHLWMPLLLHWSEGLPCIYLFLSIYGQKKKKRELVSQINDMFNRICFIIKFGPRKLRKCARNDRGCRQFITLKLSLIWLIFRNTSIILTHHYLYWHHHLPYTLILMGSQL